MSDSPVENVKPSKAESAPLPTQPPANTQEVAQQAQVAENFIEIYHAISEWIRFADAKAAVMLTVGGAMAGFLIPSFSQVIRSEHPHVLPYWLPIATTLFILYITFFIWSAIQAFLCINPLRERGGRHPALKHCPHFHPASIAVHFSPQQVEDFLKSCDQLNSDKLRREIQAGILFDSHISSKKYDRVRLSLRMFAVSSTFGFLYFLCLVF